MPGPGLRETAMNKISKSQLLRSWSFSRGTRNHTKKDAVGQRGLDPDGGFESPRVPGVGFLVWRHWSRVPDGRPARLCECSGREGMEKALRQEQHLRSDGGGESRCRGMSSARYRVLQSTWGLEGLGKDGHFYSKEWKKNFEGLGKSSAVA